MYLRVIYVYYYAFMVRTNVRYVETSENVYIYIVKSRFLFNHETAGNRSRTREPAA